MISNFKIILFTVLGMVSLLCSSQTTSNGELALFTDRDYCVSGDSVWVKAFIPENLTEQGNIARIELISNGNNLIAGIAKKSRQNWIEGYIPIPDSLSSGLYFITAFLNAQRQQDKLELTSKAVFIYNRFENEISELKIPDENAKIPGNNYNKAVKINSNKNEYSPREKVSVNIDINTNRISNAIVKASLVDPFSASFGGRYKLEMQSSNKNIPVIPEKDGLLISGKIFDSEKNTKNGILVVLSVPGDTPYFDYCVSGELGEFSFFLKDAVGKASILLQTVSNDYKEYIIIPEKNFLIQEKSSDMQSKILTVSHADFIKSYLNGVFIHKIFNPILSIEKYSFSMPKKFSLPFYGSPKVRVIPDEFIDLPDFQEISRELLPGVQYRIRNGEVFLRMLNEQQSVFFSNEPLRLINGIPIFKNSLLSSLKSTDIKSIDIVQSERLYGDLVFKGILALTLYDNSNSWAALQPNIFQFNIDCLQPDKEPGYIKERGANANLPDIRPVFVYETLTGEQSKNFSFYLSDLKGNVEITVEGITNNNEVFKTSKIVSVK